MSNINERIKVLRDESGLKQEQIADYLGVTQSYISKVEKGERELTVDQLEKIASLFGHSLASFNDTDNSPLPMKIAFRANEISSDDLNTIAEINKIAINSKFMYKLLENDND